MWSRKGRLVYMDETTQAVVALRLSGATYEEIARQLGVPGGALYAKDMAQTGLLEIVQRLTREEDR